MAELPQLGWALGWDLQGSVVLVLMYNELTTLPDPSTKPLQWLLRNPSVLYKYGCEVGLVAHCFLTVRVASSAKGRSRPSRYDELHAAPKPKGPLQEEILQ